MIRLFPFLLLGFKIWMLVDAIRRREPYYWIMIIFFIPFGSVVYFFMVKMKDYDLEGIAAKFQRPPSVDTLRTEYERTPSLSRLLALAEGLTAADRSAEAVNLCREALEREPDNPDALYGLGEARLRLGDYTSAIEVLSRLIELDRGFREFGAWPLLADALYQSGQKELCLSKVCGLFETNPRLDHANLFAHYLIQSGEKTEARDVLTTAIYDHRVSPRFLRRRNFRAGLKAKRMLKTCREG